MPDTEPTQLVTDETRARITTFIEDMNEKARSLPTYDGTDYPRDDECAGAYLEETLFTGVTIIMDWGYLDAPSTTLVIDTDAPGYAGPSGPFLPDAGQMFDQLDAELQAVLDCAAIEYDDSYSDSESHLWHIHGATPW